MQWIVLIFITLVTSKALKNNKKQDKNTGYISKKNTYRKIVVCSSNYLSELKIITAIKYNCNVDDVIFTDDHTIICNELEIPELWVESLESYDIVYMEPADDEWIKRGWENPNFETKIYQEDWEKAQSEYFNYLNNLYEDNYENQEENITPQETARIINFPQNK